MSDEKKPTTDAGQNAPDLTKFVPKEDYEAQKSNLEKLQNDFERVKSQILDPDYLEYLESKKAKAISKTNASSEVQDALGTLSAEEIERLPKSRLLDLAERRITDKLSASMRQEFNETIGTLRSTVQNLIYERELNETKLKHSDFNSYEKEIREILSRPGASYTYEDAYFLAKAQKGNGEAAKPSVKTEKRSSGEKPSSTAPASDFEHKDYKDSKEAGDAALSAIRAKYNLDGDIL